MDLRAKAVPDRTKNLPAQEMESSLISAPHAPFDYIVKFIDSQNTNSYIRFFKYVWCSDEIFFQTLILNSTYAQQCRYYDQDIKNPKKFMRNENKAYLHYIDWSCNREDPAVFDIGDFQTLKACDALFARKFCEKKSNKLLDDIDHYLLKININN